VNPSQGNPTSLAAFDRNLTSTYWIGPSCTSKMPNPSPSGCLSHGWLLIARGLGSVSVCQLKSQGQRLLATAIRVLTLGNLNMTLVD